MLWLLLTINLLVLIIEVPTLIKNQMYKELGVFTVLFAIGLYVSLAFNYNWPLKEPFNALMAYVAPQG